MTWKKVQDMPGSNAFTNSSGAVASLAVGAASAPVGVGNVVLVWCYGSGDPANFTGVTDNALFPNTYAVLSITPLSLAGWCALCGATVLSNPVSGNLNQTMHVSDTQTLQICAAEFVGRLVPSQAVSSAGTGVGLQAAPGALTTTFEDVLVLAAVSTHFGLASSPYAYLSEAVDGNHQAMHQTFAEFLTNEDPSWTTAVGTPSGSRYWSSAAVALQGYSMLITFPQVQLITDRLAALYEAQKAVAGSTLNQNSPLIPSLQNIANNLVADVVNTQNSDFEAGMLNSVRNLLASMNVEKFSKAFLQAPVNDFASYVNRSGNTVDLTIISVGSLLAYYNGGAGGLPFANMLAWSFGDLWYSLTGSRLLNVVAGTGNGAIMSPYIGPTNGQSNGMGTIAVGAAFIPGAAVQTNAYSEVRLAAVVTTTFVGGAASPTVTVNGIDNTGGSLNWTGTLPGGNNPTTAITQQTISSGAIVAQKRATVTVGSTTGIDVGSVLIINLGQPDQESVWVEAVPNSTHFTAVFLLNHNASATVDGNNVVLLAPATSGRRCRSVTNITLGLSSHSAGMVRIDGILDRHAI
jgi:hypothetical protein